MTALVENTAPKSSLARAGRQLSAGGFGVIPAINQSGRTLTTVLLVLYPVMASAAAVIAALAFSGFGPTI